VSIAYGMRYAGTVNIKVYDARGRLVSVLKSGMQSSGLHRAGWNLQDGAGHRVPNGVYFCTVSNDGSARTAKLLIAQ
jgi:flagellar hook assembly protein FlgD